MENKDYIREYLIKKRFRVIRSFLVALLAAATICFSCILIGRHLDNNIAEQSLKSVKDSVLRSAVQCYAVEGVYSSSLEYLEKNYGLVINHSEYIVSYEAFSSNLMPSVTVLVRGE